MRVVFFGQPGPYTRVALEAFVARKGPWEVVLVVEGRRRSEGDVHRVRPPTYGSTAPTERLALWATAAGFPVLTTSDVNGDRARDVIAATKPDVLLCAGFDRLFSSGLLRLFPVAALNAHPSLLPQLRGPCPFYWAMRSPGTPMGVTVHGLEAGEDNGPLVSQHPFAARPLVGAPELFGIAAKLAGGGFADALDAISRGNLLTRAQEHAAATRAPRPKPADSRLDPENWTALALANFVSIADFFLPAWITQGDETLRFVRGIRVIPGARQRHPVTLQALDAARIQCSDGIAVLQCYV